MSEAVEELTFAPETRPTAEGGCATCSRFDADQDNIVPEPSDEFIITPYVQDVTERALAYLEIGYPVHFAGPAGTGKTTLAFHLAAQLGRPVMLIHGDDEFGTSDLIGRDAGYSKKKLVDNFIHSVLKTEEEMKMLWVDNRLTTACEKGFTLIYDEFTRSRPEANNVLLSILAEKVLNLPKLRVGGEGYLDVHPDFRAIFTSNPEEYAGTHKSQDALMDRLTTIHLGHYDRQTEIEVTMKKSGISRLDAGRIVDVVRALRSIGGSNHRPTIRACITIARILAHKGARASWDDPVFQWVCRDVLNTDTATVMHDGEPVAIRKVDDAIRKICELVTESSVKHSLGMPEVRDQNGGAVASVATDPRVGRRGKAVASHTPRRPRGADAKMPEVTAVEPDYAYSQT